MLAVGKPISDSTFEKKATVGGTAEVNPGVS